MQNYDNSSVQNNSRLKSFFFFCFFFLKDDRPQVYAVDAFLKTYIFLQSNQKNKENEGEWSVSILQ